MKDYKLKAKLNKEERVYLNIIVTYDSNTGYYRIFEDGHEVWSGDADSYDDCRQALVDYLTREPEID